MSTSEYWGEIQPLQSFKRKVVVALNWVQVSVGVEWVVDLVLSWRRKKWPKCCTFVKEIVFVSRAGTILLKQKFYIATERLVFTFLHFSIQNELLPELSDQAWGMTFYEFAAEDEIKYLFASWKYSFHVSVCSSAHDCRLWGGGRGISLVSWHWNARSVSTYPCCLLHPCNVINAKD